MLRDLGRNIECGDEHHESQEYKGQEASEAWWKLGSRSAKAVESEISAADLSRSQLDSEARQG